MGSIKNSPSKKHVVLIVDEDAGVKEFTRDILELCGHKVLTAGTRGDALILCDQWGPEIKTVVLDTPRPRPSRPRAHGKDSGNQSFGKSHRHKHL